MEVGERREFQTAETAHFWLGSLTLLLSHARPSKMPSPVVAQLGSTFHVWSLAIRCRSSMSETSLGLIAAKNPTNQ